MPRSSSELEIGFIGVSGSPTNLAHCAALVHQTAQTGDLVGAMDLRQTG